MIDLRSHTPKGQRARERILEAAEQLLVTAGFHGASMRDVAKAAGLPLATVVYHFARKEQLYGAVLERIGDELLRALDDVTLGLPVESLSGPVGAPAQMALATAWVEGLIAALLRWVRERPGRVQLLLRELLDNPSRVARATKLPLAPFLERASAVVAAAQRVGVLVPQSPELAVLQLVGAVSYVVAARPTVERIVGRTRSRALAASYEKEAAATARRILGMVESAGARSRVGDKR